MDNSSWGLKITCSEVQFSTTCERLMNFLTLGSLVPHVSMANQWCVLKIWNNILDEVDQVMVHSHSWIPIACWTMNVDATESRDFISIWRSNDQIIDVHNIHSKLFEWIFIRDENCDENWKWFNLWSIVQGDCERQRSYSFSWFGTNLGANSRVEFSVKCLNYTEMEFQIRIPD